MTEEKIGCQSDDPDNDKHNWPEYTTNEGGDETPTCTKCGVAFFGYSHRTECYACHDEQLMCPRRAGCVPHSAFPDHDEWETDRWDSPNYEAKWPEELGEHPRSCSFCGCVHPEDAIDLIKNRGWEIEPSTKCYKWYINPPGAMLHHKRLMSALSPENSEEKIEAALKAPHHEVVPPVKLYGMHGTPEQLAELNGLLDLQRSGKSDQ